MTNLPKGFEVAAVSAGARYDGSSSTPVKMLRFRVNLDITSITRYLDADETRALAAWLYEQADEVDKGNQR